MKYIALFLFLFMLGVTLSGLFPYGTWRVGVKEIKPIIRLARIAWVIFVVSFWSFIFVFIVKMTIGPIRNPEQTLIDVILFALSIFSPAILSILTFTILNFRNDILVNGKFYHTKFLTCFSNWQRCNMYNRFQYFFEKGKNPLLSEYNVYISFSFEYYTIKKFYEVGLFRKKSERIIDYQDAIRSVLESLVKKHFAGTLSQFSTMSLVHNRFDNILPEFIANLGNEVRTIYALQPVFYNISYQINTPCTQISGELPVVSG